MKKQGHRKGRIPRPKPGQIIGPATRRTTKRELDSSFLQATQFKRDVFRGAKPSDIIHFMERQAEQDPTLEKSEQDEDALSDSGSDISINDDDGEDTIFDQTRDLAREEEFVTIDDDIDNTWHSDYTDRIPIIVIDGKAIFRTPEWAISYNEPDLHMRWETYAQIADWLNQEKRDFLRKPSHFTLAQGMIDPASPIPVLQKDLRRLLGLQCHITTFSKHARYGIIVWPTREFPLEGLWSHETRIAWCAQATLQRQKTRGYAAECSPLGDMNIQPPRGAKERQIIESQRTNAWRLGPTEFAELLCILTGCKWRDVLTQYRAIIFYEENNNG